MTEHIDDMTEEESNFDFCGKVDVHCLDNSNLATVVAVAGEHGFRGIVVSLARLESLVKEINKQATGSIDIIPIVAIDYPNGCMSLDVRNYSILSAKENGAKEIEIMAPQNLIYNKDYKKLEEDIKSIGSSCQNAQIKAKYILDKSFNNNDDTFKNKLCKLINNAKIESISIVPGDNGKHSDNVLLMRNFKKRSNCNVKIYIDTEDVEEFALYPKAGADFIGLNWRSAPSIVHSYEELINKKSS